jgi:iron complex transport system substrate-binding protein
MPIKFDMKRERIIMKNFLKSMRSLALTGLTAFVVSNMSSTAFAKDMHHHNHDSMAMTKTITDVEGRTVEVPSDPQRIFLGFYFEDFLAIGGEKALDRVVGISRATWKDWRPGQWQAYSAALGDLDRLEDAGEVDAGTFSAEKVVALKPDVVVLSSWQYKALGAQSETIEASGIPVVVTDYNAQTLERHIASTKALGVLLGQEDRAEKLITEYETAVKDVMARVAKAQAEGAEPKKVYVELGNKGADDYGNSYGNGMWGGVIELAGGINIAKDQVSNWGPLNPEYILSQNPDIVLIAGSEWLGSDNRVLLGFGVEPATTQERLLPYLGRPGWSNLAAVKNQNVHAIYHGGARTLYDYTFLQYIAKQLYPEAFADMDPVANHRRYYETWLPVQAEGTFFMHLQADKAM